MRKPKRKKVHRAWLENQLAKCERRIQKIAEQAYYIRQAIAALDKQEEMQQAKKEEAIADIASAAVDAGKEAAG